MKLGSSAFDAVQQRLFKTQAKSALRNSMKAAVLPYGADAFRDTTPSGPDKAGSEAGTRIRLVSALSRDSLPAGLADRRTQRLVATGTGCHRDKAQQ